MKSTFAIATALIFGGIANSSALLTDFSINFDTQVSGTDAQNSAPAGFNIDAADFAPAIDGNGDTIPGSETWQPDASTTAIAEDPLVLGYGTAPSGTNALNGVDQPVLLSFDTPYNLTSFSMTLDSTSFGFDFFEVQFYNETNGLLSAITLDQTIPSLIFTAGPLNGVSKIVLPSGAFYDNLSFAGASIPEPGTIGLTSATLLGLVAWKRRRKA